ncbi:3501_t:CDS:2 [Scutellospora calospora]|uniref:3501_t:CDS:1 n=1 Tax=Scutellospora calospora TaxID=85575 RepID=A0ACA9L498_9GLOM|nr:3501_t:CDS:2 [Scutellospora calospora]
MAYANATIFLDQNVYLTRNEQVEFMRKSIAENECLIQSEKAVLYNIIDLEFDQSNFTNWTSGDETVDNLIKKCQSSTIKPDSIVKIRQDINTPLWIQIFYAVIGILEFISTSYILGIKLFGTKCMWFFQFFLTLAPFWIMLVPQVSLIIIFWETISTTIHYPTIILGFLIELLIIKLLYKKISLTYSINFVMSINQAVVLITIYCNNTYLTKALLALTTLVVTRILDYFSTEITKKSHFHPFGCFLKEVYNAFDLVNSEKCPKIKRFIESNMKDFAVNESIDENSKGDDDGKPKDDEKSKGDENFKRDSKSKEEIDNEIV